MSATTFVGTVNNGKFIPDSPSGFRMAFSYLEGKRAIVIVSKLVRRRTNQQSKAWWGIVIYEFSQLLGEYDKDQIHRIVLEQIGHFEVIERGGRQIKVLKPTHNLPMDEFSKLYEAAQYLAAEWFGHSIPDPEKVMTTI